MTNLHISFSTMSKGGSLRITYSNKIIFSLIKTDYSYNEMKIYNEKPSQGRKPAGGRRVQQSLGICRYKTLLNSVLKQT